MTRLLLADDQALIRMGFRMVLEAEDDLEVVGEADDGRSAVSQAVALRPDVVLMDVRMPGMNGIEATERIVAEVPEAKVLILTTFDLDEYAFAGLRAGASGFLLKNAEPTELVAAIRAVASGDAVISPRVTRRMLEIFSGHLPEPGATDTGLDPRLAELTPRELATLRSMADGKSNKEIAVELGISERTVKAHLGHLFEKLGVTSRTEAIKVGTRRGLVRLD